MSDYLPSEIRYKNEEARRKALEFDLRQRIRTEINFMSLRQEDRDAIRQQYLASRDFNPNIPMRDNDWVARLAYHRSDLELIRDHDFMAFYLSTLE
jgi:hypothetical protein